MIKTITIKGKKYFYDTSKKGTKCAICNKKKTFLVDENNKYYPISSINGDEVVFHKCGYNKKRRGQTKVSKRIVEESVNQKALNNL